MLPGLEDYFYLNGNVAEQKVNDKKVYNSAHSVQDAWSQSAEIRGVNFAT